MISVSRCILSRVSRILGKPYLLLLLIVHVIVFWGYYTGQYGFPFDFSYTYYAFVAYWISAFQAGNFPDWVPFQAMGYPIMLNPQAYLFYPPNWFFALSGLPYSGQAHVVLQCLHILLGAIGFYCLGVVLLKDRRLAFIGALAYHFFGGFYCNAQHADIIRAFSLLPWLFWALYLERGQDRLALRNLFLPVIVFLIGTGVYPGNVISFYFLLFLYCSLELSVFLYRRLRQERKPGLPPSFWLLILSVIGVVMALPQIYPSLLFGHETYRGANAESILKNGWDARLLLTLIFSWNRAGMPYDISMISLYVGIPIVMGLFYLTKKVTLDDVPWIAVAVVAVLMIPASSSFSYRLLTTWIPPLGLSRFPTSDYRPVVAVFIILLSLSGLDAILRGDRYPDLIARTIIGIVFFILIFNGWTGFTILEDELIAASIVLFLAILTICLSLKFEPIRRYFPYLYVALVLMDAWRVIPGTELTWRTIPTDDFYRQKFGFSTTDAPIRTILRDPPQTRPERSEEPDTQSWDGYMNGTYHINDYSGLILNSRYRLRQNPAAVSFMKKEWLPLSINPSKYCRELSKLGTFLESQSVSSSLKGEVRQLMYGTDNVHYAIDTQSPVVFVENEIFFPGWRAMLIDASGNQSEIQAKSCQGLRMWKIPAAGSYTMQAEYRFPFSRRLIAVSALTMLFYLVFLGWRFVLCSMNVKSLR